MCRHVQRSEQAAAATLELLLQRAALASTADAEGGGAGRRAAGKSGVSTHAASLFAEGKAANGAADHWRASQLFEHAYVAQVWDDGIAYPLASN